MPPPAPRPQPTAAVAAARPPVPTPTAQAPAVAPIASPGIGPAALPIPAAPAPAPQPIPSSPQRASGASGASAIATNERDARGRLVIIAKDGGEGQSFPLGEILDIGRSDGDVVIPDDRYLSPRHARLLWKDRRLILRDLGSVNGAYLRLRGAAQGAPPQPLHDQDLILIGQQVIRFEIVKDAEEGLGAAMQHGTLLFGTPAAPRYARLCQRTVEGVSRDVFHVRKPETVLGRESGDVVFPDDFLARRHAVVRMDAAKTFTIEDFGSSNGTFLQLRGDAIVKAGDEFRVGQQLFRLYIGEA